MNTHLSLITFLFSLPSTSQVSLPLFFLILNFYKWCSFLLPIIFIIFSHSLLLLSPLYCIPSLSLSPILFSFVSMSICFSVLGLMDISCGWMTIFIPHKLWKEIFLDNHIVVIKAMTFNSLYIYRTYLSQLSLTQYLTHSKVWVSIGNRYPPSLLIFSSTFQVIKFKTFQSDLKIR